MKESTVEEYLWEEVARAGGHAYKFVSPGRCGVPDRIVVWPRLTRRKKSSRCDVHFVEMKAPGEKPEAHQAREHRRLRALGAFVLVLDTKQKVDAYVAEYRPK